MEVGQGPNWGCSVKGKKVVSSENSLPFSHISFQPYMLSNTTSRPTF
jgi:hypothetical protein